MNPEQVFRALESTHLRPGDFTHRSHVQAAWWVLSEDGAVDGTQRFIAAIRGFIESVGAHDKYNETLTRAFLQVIGANLRPGEDWDSFEARNPRLLNQAQELLAHHYSAARLQSADARVRFVSPDLGPLPTPDESAAVQAPTARKPTEVTY